MLWCCYCCCLPHCCCPRHLHCWCHCPLLAACCCSDLQGASDAPAPKTDSVKYSSCKLQLGIFKFKLLHLCVSEPQPSQTTRAVGFSVDCVELLFYGAEICHERIQVYVFPLVQCLCRQTDGKTLEMITETGMDTDF